MRHTVRMPRRGFGRRRETDSGDDGPAAVPLYERQAALDRAIELFTQAQKLQKTVVATLGSEPGAGKTGFLTHLEGKLAQLNGDDGPLILAGSAPSSASTVQAYRPISAALGAARLSPMPRRRAIRRVVRALDRSLPAWLGLVPEAGKLLVAVDATRRELSASTVLDVPQMADPRRDQFLRWVKGVVEDGLSLVFLLDDMHWSDSSTLELLKSLIVAPPRGTIFVVLAYRSTDLGAPGRPSPLRLLLPEIQQHARAETLKLPPLTRDGLASVIADTTGHPASEAMLDELDKQSHGNPFIARQLVWHWQETNRVTVASGRVRLRPEPHESDTKSLELPSQVEGLMHERLNQLIQEERRTLEVAVVVGPFFTASAVAVVGGFDERPIRDVLGAICERSGILAHERLPGGGWVYAFSHPLLADYLRNTLRLTNRPEYAQLHAREAQRLESERDSSLASLSAIARHWHESGIDDQAFEACLRAALANKVAGTVAEAEVFANWATTHTSRIAAQLDAVHAHRLLGGLQLDLRQLEQAVGSLSKADRLLDQTTVEGGLAAHVKVELAKAHRMQNDWNAARACLARAAELSAADPSGPHAAIDRLTGEVELCGFPPNLPDARAALQRALDVESDECRRSAIFGHLALVALPLDGPAGADAALHDATRSAKACASPVAAYETALFRAHCALACLDLPAADRAVKTMSEVSSDHGMEDTENHRYRARVRALQHNWSEAAEAYADFFEAEHRRCATARLVAGDVNEERLWWAPAHLEEQHDELLVVAGRDAAVEFDQSAIETMAFAQLADIYPDLKLRANALRHGAVSGLRAQTALERHGVPRAPAWAARWAFNFYVHDLAAFRRSLKLYE